MTFSTDDLASVLVAPDREHTGYGQGILISFDTTTFANIVEYRGSRLTNLPVLDRVGALTYQPGDVVLLMRWSPTGRGLSSFWIAGAPVIPVAGRAEEAIAFMSTSLAASIVDDLVEQLLTSPEGEELAAFVIGQRVHTASVDGLVTSLGTSYGGGGQGPVVADVSVSDARRALVQISCGISVVAGVGQVSGQGWMSFAVSGASTIAASDAHSESHAQSGSFDQLDGSGIRATSTILLTAADGLNAGLNTFTAQYRRDFGDGDVAILNRNLTVTAF